MPLIRVTLTPFLAALPFLASALNLYLFFVGWEPVSLLLAIAFGCYTYVLLKRAHVLVQGNLVYSRSGLGFSVTLLRFASPHDLQIDGRTLWVQTSEGRKRISGTAANSRHWRLLGEAIAEAQAAAPRTVSA